MQCSSIFLATGIVDWRLAGIHPSYDLEPLLEWLSGFILGSKLSSVKCEYFRPPVRPH